MNILVTGGAGFLGKNLCLELLKKGHKVVVLDNFITSRIQDFKEFSKLKNLKFYKGDITDAKFMQKIKKAHKFSEIYHLACPTGVPNIEILGEEMLLICSVGTLNVLEMARDQKAKLVLTSSSEVYGDPEVFPQSEGYTGNVDPVGDRSPYEEGKRFAESLVMFYVKKYKVEGKIVRIFNTYGFFMNPEDMRVIPQFIESALKGEGLKVKGKGFQRRTFCFADDLVQGLVLVMSKGEVGEVYNLGSDKEISIIELAKLINEITGSKGGVKHIDRESHDHKARRPDLRKVKKLGFRSRINLKEGLKRILSQIEIKK